MKPWIWKVALLLLAFILTGGAVVVLGIVPIKASTGHWPIAGWFLNFAKERSIHTHSRREDEPNLDEPWLVIKGAGHYEIACAPCHGRPNEKLPKITQSMLPPPPFLPSIIIEREPRELFYAIKHGIKFTGMPAWPSPNRDDEIEAVVAFLLTLPKLTTKEYQQLTGTEPDTRIPLENLLAKACVPCHGLDGNGRGAAPKISGQKREYLTSTMRAYANNERFSGIMQPISESLSPEEILSLADYYSGLSSEAPPQTTQESSALKRGEDIAQNGIPKQGVPACVDCHGPSATQRNAAYPNLSGQYAHYLNLQLRLLKEKNRGGSDYAHIMELIASRLTEEQAHDVALYYESLPPEQENHEELGAKE